jgi:hypothetical protein
MMATNPAASAADLNSTDDSCHRIRSAADYFAPLISALALPVRQSATLEAIATGTTRVARIPVFCMGRRSWRKWKLVTMFSLPSFRRAGLARDSAKSRSVKEFLKDCRGMSIWTHPTRREDDSRSRAGPNTP